MIFALLSPVSYQLNWFAIPNLLTASMMVALGVVVLIRERHSRVSFTFFVMAITAAVWLYGYSLMYCAVTEPVAAAWSFVGQIGVTMIPPSVYHFTVASLQLYHQRRHFVWLAWLISALFLFTLTWGDAFLGGVYLYPWGFYPRYHWMGGVFVLFFFAQMALSLRHYWVSYHAAATEVARLRNRGLFTAFCVAYFGSVDFLAAFGVPIYPFGYFGILGFVVLIDRTIKRYHLVNITPAFAAREIINAMDDALLVLDDEGMVRVANPSACRLLGRSETDLEGSSVSTVARAFETVSDEFPHQILDGSLRDHQCLTRDGKALVSVSSFVMNDHAKSPMATVCMIHDITQQKAAQEQIRRHTERQAALYELNLAATSTLELRAVLDALLERLADLVIGTSTTIFLLDPSSQQLRKVACRGIDEKTWKSEHDAGDATIHPVLETKDAVWVHDMRTENAGLDSDYFRREGFLSYLGVPLMAKDQVIGILSFYSRDKRRYSDEEINFLRGLAGHAAVAIYNSQLYEQTCRQAVALEKANQVKEDFLSVMSHELRTPLNVISGYTKLVQDGVMGEINPEQKRALDKVIHHAEELLFMVNSIMNATKIEAGALTVDREEFLLGDLLEELRGLYDYPLGKEILLAWDFPSDLPLLFTDRDKLKHVMQNLINNAIKFTDQGSITITARHYTDRAQVELTVMDTGIGISADALPRIFDRFRQGDSSQTRGFGGVGLGLHIVKTFSEILGGSVRVASQPGQGSVFTITLPSVEPVRASSLPFEN